MKKLFTLAAALLLPLTVMAHGPSPQKTEKSITLKAEPAKVWSVLKDPANLTQWHPAAQNAKFRSADDGDMKFKYEIADGTLAAADCLASLTVAAGPNAGESTVTWVVRYYRIYKLNPPIPAGQDDESAINAVNGMMDAGLAALGKRMAGQ